MADIHGNASALEAVLAACRAKGVERLLCCGDFVGYYYQPDRVLELLTQWDCQSVKGNHEDMLFDALNDKTVADYIRKRYGSGIEFARKRLSDKQIDFLHNLPRQNYLTFGSEKLLLCHGSPWDTNYYVYPDSSENIFVRCSEAGVDFLVLGHTHYPMAKRLGTTLIINPGSVGQPRNGKAGAGWAFLDTETGFFEQHVESYEINIIEAQARKIDMHLPFLWEVLNR